MRSDVVHIADCGEKSLWWCRRYCRGVVYHPHECKYNKLGIAFGEEDGKDPQDHQGKASEEKQEQEKEGQG